MNLLIQSILLILLYFISVPFSFWFKDWIAYQIRKKRRNNIRQNKQPTEELTYKQKIKREKKFALKEASNKNVIRLIYVLTILIGPIVAIKTLLWGAVLSFFIPYVFIGIVHNMISAELAARDKLISRMLDFKRSKLGLIDNKASIMDYT